MIGADLMRCKSGLNHPALKVCNLQRIDDRLGERDVIGDDQNGWFSCFHRGMKNTLDHRFKSQIWEDVSRGGGEAETPPVRKRNLTSLPLQSHALRGILQP